MATTPTKAPDFTILAARDSFGRHLHAANKSPRTIQSYTEAVELLDRYLADKGMPRDVTAIRRESVEGCLVDMQQQRGANGKPRYRPSSIANRFRSLRVFFNWLVREDEIDRSPMAKMPAPGSGGPHRRPPADRPRRALVMRSTYLADSARICPNRERMGSRGCLPQPPMRISASSVPAEASQMAL